MTIPDTVIASAQQTADAYDEPAYVLAGSEHVEPDPICLRGRWFVSRNEREYAGLSYGQFPTVCVLCVLPWGYRVRF